MKMKKSKKVKTVRESFGEFVKLFQMKQPFHFRENIKMFWKRRKINFLTQQQWRIVQTTAIFKSSD